jgi:hypothetical protein
MLAVTEVPHRRIDQAQARGGEAICARTAVAAATSRSARVSGSPASAGVKPTRTIWSSMQR